MHSTHIHSWAHTQVWYEWGLTEPLVTPIHNPNGRSYHIGL